MLTTVVFRQDIKSGCVYLDDHIEIGKDLTFTALVEQGVKFDGEIDMGNGWMLFSSWNHCILGRQVNVSFGFFKGCLKKFGFALISGDGRDLEGLKIKHDALLNELFGIPQKKNEILIAYDFVWGTVSSQLDPRGGSCSVEFYWK
ncbi:hypothetical protein [Pseudomonas sp. Seg1]|uniref:hypothetical protein n=1 Tax=Pseudomonas sp. Seg1 TaxID=2678259 RepID=UPI001BB3B380|nr:hypothetical protein [Pseudomonas sp. Seg1]